MYGLLSWHKQSFAWRVHCICLPGLPAGLLRSRCRIKQLRCVCRRLFLTDNRSDHLSVLLWCVLQQRFGIRSLLPVPCGYVWLCGFCCTSRMHVVSTRDLFCDSWSCRMLTLCRRICAGSSRPECLYSLQPRDVCSERGPGSVSALRTPHIKQCHLALKCDGLSCVPNGRVSAVTWSNKVLSVC